MGMMTTPTTEEAKLQRIEEIKEAWFGDTQACLPASAALDVEFLLVAWAEAYHRMKRLELAFEVESINTAAFSMIVRAMGGRIDPETTASREACSRVFLETQTEADMALLRRLVT